ncbi:MAG: glycerate kinase [Candidatus Ratteibacteria bacterium]|nr:glycerate kinase [Candidatus Ratteibacteria bacterium]
MIFYYITDMKIIIAPTSYKGSITNVEAADIMKAASRRVFPSAKLIIFPLADGGEGTLDVIKKIAGGSFVFEDISGPLGRRIKGRWLKKGDTGWIEMAQAAGLTLLKEKERDPLKTTTYGVGELIKGAVLSGCRKVYICVGGSATNDGGIGALTALGVRFFDRGGKVIYPGRGKNLIEIKDIDTSRIIPQLKKCKFKVLSDVENPLYGRYGAAYVYASQKGATDRDIEILDKGLRNYNKIVKKVTGVDMNSIGGSGAAGGIAGGFTAFLGAEIVSGIRTILKMGGFESKIKGADILLTGEGRTDVQTIYGKAIGVVMEICKRHRVPVVILTGSVDDAVYRNKSFKDAIILSIVPKVVSLHEAMKRGKEFLYYTTEQVLRIYKNACKN